MSEKSTSNHPLRDCTESSSCSHKQSFPCSDKENRFYLLFRFFAPASLSAYYAFARIGRVFIDDASFLLISHGVSFLLTLFIIMLYRFFFLIEKKSRNWIDFSGFYENREKFLMDFKQFMSLAFNPVFFLKNTRNFFLWKDLDRETLFWILSRTMSVFITAWSFQSITRSFPVYMIGLVKSLKPFILMMVGCVFFGNKLYAIDLLSLIFMGFLAFYVEFSHNSFSMSGFDSIALLYAFLGVISSVFCEFIIKKVTTKKNQKLHPLNFSCLISLCLTLVDFVTWFFLFQKGFVFCNHTGIWYAFLSGILHAVHNILIILSLKNISLVSSSLISFSNCFWVFIMGFFITGESIDIFFLLNGLMAIFINLVVLFIKEKFYYQ